MEDRLHAHPNLAHASREAASWIPPLASFGYAAKGAVYLIVGYIAAKAAFAAGTPTGASGALAELVDEQYGRVLLALIAAGLFAHVLWRLVQAVLDPEHPEHDNKRLGARAFHALSAVIYGSLAMTALGLLRGRTDGSAGQEQSFAATLLEQPFGRWLLGLVGVGVIAYGIHQLVKAFRGDVAKRLGIADADKHRAVVAIGRVGTAARGVVLGILGAFAIDAARRYDASAVGGTEDALRWLGSGWTMAAVAVGLMAYGVLQLAKARYRRIGAPTQLH